MNALALILGLAVTQDAGPPRPRLGAKADTNDWQAYYDHGMGQIRSRASRAEVAFIWAGRLAPDRAEPLQARWLAYWMNNIQDFLDHRRGRRSPPGAAAADTLRWRAWGRNPLLPPTAELLIYDELPGEWRQDPLTRGLLFFAEGHHAQAAELWERVLRANPRRHAWLRYGRASLYAQTQEWDAALADLVALTGEFSRIDTTVTLLYYASREVVYHAIGMLHIARNDAAAARAALGQALTENLGYAPAHATLGDVALHRRDLATALTEWSLAVELAPDDVWYRYRLGGTLLDAGRRDSAVAVLTDVIRRNPVLADAYLDLGRAKEGVDVAGATAAYRAYLAHAARRESTKIQWVERRLAALGP